MARLRLTYFDLAGSRGEECRLALVLAGVDFEDVRIRRPEWVELKPTTPWGTVPVLEVPGRGEIGQTHAILTYVGRLHGLLPDDPFEAARHEAILCAGEDLRTALAATLSLADDDKRRAREALADGALPAFGRRVEAQITGPFVGGERVSVADLKLFTLVRWMKGGTFDHVPATVFDPFERLVGVHDAVATDPRVRAWYDR